MSVCLKNNHLLALQNKYGYSFEFLFACHVNVVIATDFSGF
jgi:hypothetical protein